MRPVELAREESRLGGHSSRATRLRGTDFVGGRSIECTSHISMPRGFGQRVRAGPRLDYRASAIIRTRKLARGEDFEANSSNRQMGPDRLEFRGWILAPGSRGPKITVPVVATFVSSPRQRSLADNRESYRAKRECFMWKISILLKCIYFTPRSWMLKLWFLASKKIYLGVIPRVMQKCR